MTQQELFARTKDADFVYLNRNYFLRVSVNRQFLQIVSEHQEKALYFYLGFKVFSVHLSGFSGPLYTKVELEDTPLDGPPADCWVKAARDRVSLRPKVAAGDS